VQRSEAQISATNAQPLLLQAIQKRHDQRGVNLLEIQLGRCFMQPLLHELQELTEGVAVGTDGVGTRLALLHWIKLSQP
jgi:hypothetical protein